MNSYMMFYTAPALHEDVADQLEDRVHGCITMTQIGYTTIVCFESNDPIKVLRGYLRPEKADLILIEVNDFEKMYLEFRNPEVRETIAHPLDPNVYCEHKGKLGNFSIDELLDKINKLGYNALTDKEKAFLEKNS